MYVRTKWQIFCGAISLAVLHGSLSAQSAATPAEAPKFEVASIRPNPDPYPKWTMNFTADGVMARDVTLLWVLHEAFTIYDDDLWSGGPAWLDKARFDINAKYDVSQYPNLTVKERQAMLQQLLAERFHLVVHHELKEFPLYALVAAKGGPKFEETKPEDLRKSDLFGVMCTNKGRPGTIEMQGCTMTALAQRLGGLRSDLGRRVVDQTGLPGHYTFVLHWTRMDAPASEDVNAPGPIWPTIFTAVKEQLGLELKPIKGSLDTIVIDHAEMPSEN
jgi:uncharacterized protein (TIGR03435 family)